jgi:GAF domain-containing protein
VPLDLEAAPAKPADAPPAADDDLDFVISIDDADVPPRWTLDEAFAALARTGGRDEVVSVALRYARDFFEAVALLAIARGRVRGHDAAGWDGARERCRAISVAAHDVGLVRTVLATSGPYLGPVAPDDGNEALLSALGRAGPRTALVYPIMLRERPVAVLYADNGAAPVSPRRVGDLLVLLGALGAALERIIRDAKRAAPQTP